MSSWSSSDTRRPSDEIPEDLQQEALTEKLQKVKTEQDKNDESERAEAAAGISWDGDQYRVESRTDPPVGKAADPEKQDAEPIFIEFDEGDPANPFNWPKAKKWRVTFMFVVLRSDGMVKAKCGR